MRTELRSVLLAAPAGASQADLRRLVMEENVTGKASAVTREKTWQRLKDRYVMDPSAPAFRAFAAALHATGSAAEQGLLCLLMMARQDRLFREVTLACFGPLLRKAGTVVDPAVVQEAILARVRATGREWSAETVETVRQHLLSSLKDFGVLEGSARKRIVTPRPGVQATLFAARIGRFEGLTDRQILASRWFRLLGQEREEAVELLYAAARAGALRFRLQADIVELVLPELEPA